MQKIFGLVAAMAMIVAMLITSFEIAIYSDYGWYQKEYEKYQVLDDLEMEMQDVMDVTEEMMAYLRGDRKNLEVKTVIAGEEGMFFNEREKLHMEDVQGLFLGGIQIRRVAFVIFAAAVLLILFQKGNLREILPQMYGWAVGPLGWQQCLEGWSRLISISISCCSTRSFLTMICGCWIRLRIC